MTIQEIFLLEVPSAIDDEFYSGVLINAYKGRPTRFSRADAVFALTSESAELELPTPGTVSISFADVVAGTVITKFSLVKRDAGLDGDVDSQAPAGGGLLVAGRQDQANDRRAGGNTAKAIGSSRTGRG